MKKKQKTLNPTDNIKELKKLILRMDGAYYLFFCVIDDEGVGYGHIPKKAVNSLAIITLINKLEAEKKYLQSILDKGIQEQFGAGVN